MHQNKLTDDAIDRNIDDTADSGIRKQNVRHSILLLTLHPALGLVPGAAGERGLVQCIKIHRKGTCRYPSILLKPFYALSVFGDKL